MRKANSKWKVFVIALCMVFTMIPNTAFADELVVLPSVEQGVEQGLDAPLPVVDGLGDTNQEVDGEQIEAEQDTESAPPVEDEQLGGEEKLSSESQLENEVDTVLPPEGDITPLTFFPDIKFRLEYRDNDNNGALIDIESVSYKKSGETNLKNPYFIYIPYWIFGPTKKVDVSYYVPDKIIDTDGVAWALNDQGGGQKKNVTVYKRNEDWNKNVQPFHYKKVTNPPAPTTGSITISKVIQGDPMPETDETFTFTICKGGFSTTALISSEDNYVKTISGLLPGEYTVSEVSIPTNYSLSGDNGRPITVVAGKDSSETFTNVYDEPTTPPTTGAITITKVIEGDPMPEIGETFTFTISKEGFSTTASISSEDSYEKTISGLQPGSYTVSEVSIPTNYSLNGANNIPAAVVAGDNFPITFTNHYDKPTTPPTTGAITITKVIEGDPMPEIGETFTFTISNDGYTTTASILSKDSNKITIGNLPAGTYWVKEVDIPDYYSLKSENDMRADVVAGGDYPITFTNSYKKPVVPPDDEDKAKAYVTKTVAEYDGKNLPADSAYDDDLKLNTLGRSVIFKMTLSCNKEWIEEEKYTGFLDLFNYEDLADEDLTDELLVLDDGEFVNAVAYYHDFPHPIELSDESKIVLYHIAKLDKEGTYTNTANILDYTSEIEYDIAASASAVVMVEEEDGDDDTTTTHHHHSVNNSTPTTVIPPVDNSSNVEPVQDVVPVNELDDVPKTGSDAPIMPFIFLGSLAVAILSFLSRKHLTESESK